MNNEEMVCAKCREIREKIEAVDFPYETVELEAVLYRHRAEGRCYPEVVEKDVFVPLTLEIIL